MAQDPNAMANMMGAFGDGSRMGDLMKNFGGEPRGNDEGEGSS